MNMFAVFLLIPSLTFCGLPGESPVKLMVRPDHPDWEYRLNEPVEFLVSVYRWGHPVKGARVRYSIGPEQMTPLNIDSAVLEGEVLKIKGGTLRNPGFLRCGVEVSVDGRTYQNLATAAFEPKKIRPTVKFPLDFSSFWDKTLALARKFPLDSKIEPQPALSTANLKVFHVSFQNDKPGRRIFGMLRVPQGKGTFPALLGVPSYGVSAYTGDVLEMAEEGIITLEIGIHGIPVNQPDSVYEALFQGPLKEYKRRGVSHRDSFYYKGVFTGCARAVDFIFSLPEFDKKRLAVFGGSQGGGLAIVTASLDKRIKWLAVEYPGFCDLTGFFSGRAGGWPPMRPEKLDSSALGKIVKVLPYFDAVNFAKRITVPGLYSLGYNDLTCPPTSVFAALNSITAPKTVMVFQDEGHWDYPEQTEKVRQWLLGALKGR